MHYYKRNIGDYSKKAGRLSLLQHGVYTLLIDACYDRERFPTREEALDWVWAGSPEEIAAVDFVLGKFFTLKDGRYVQKRIAEEIAEYHIFCEQQSAKGKAGGRPKKPDGNPPGFQGNPMESHCKATESLTTNHEPLTTNHDFNICTEPPARVLFVSLILNDKSEYPIFEDQIAEWQGLYPAVDIRQELRNMRGWCLANPRKCKTKAGILRFVTSWLSSKQDRGGSHEKTRRNGEHLTPVQRVQQAFAERRAGGETLDGGGVDLRGQVDSQAR